MNQRSFNMWAGVVFLIVFVVHALRLLKGWSVTIEDYSVPTWVSWVAVVLAGCLAYHGLFKKR